MLCRGGIRRWCRDLSLAIWRSQAWLHDGVVFLRCSLGRHRFAGSRRVVSHFDGCGYVLASRGGVIGGVRPTWPGFVLTWCVRLVGAFGVGVDTGYRRGAVVGMASGVGGGGVGGVDVH